MDCLFSGKMRLADLVSANGNLILMLPRSGIPLGFGDSRVSEVCARYAIPEDFFLLIANVYTFGHYIPDQDQIGSTDMQRLVPYLQASHDYYLHSRLKHIGSHLEDLARAVDHKHG